VAVAVSDPVSCRSCPLCQGLAALREADPDAVRRVELASAGLISAVRELFAGPPPDHPWHPPVAFRAPAWVPIEIGD
jgi:hypothetical protein